MSSPDFDHIFKILGRFEGAGLVRGYIPTGRDGAALGNSGVTIGTGIDLGQQTQAGLLAMGVPAGVVTKLLPYIGLRRQSAVDKLALRPLELSPAEVEQLDAAVVSACVAEVAAHFDAQAGADGGPGESGLFAGLPKNVQAVLVSLRYQLGFGGFPRTWRMIVDDDREAAVEELETPARWGGRYVKRRRAEAALLREAWRM